MAEVRYESNKALVGNGTRITRVSSDGQVLEVMVDAKAERFSRVILHEPDLRTIDTFAVTGGPFVNPGDYLRAEAVFHREFIVGMTDAEAIAYLLDVIERNIAAGNERMALVTDAAGRNENGRLQLSRTMAQALLIFWDARGRVVTNTLFNQRFEQETSRILSKLVFSETIDQLNVLFNTLNWPVTIKVFNDSSCQMDLLTPTWLAPWEAV